MTVAAGGEENENERVQKDLAEVLRKRNYDHAAEILESVEIQSIKQSLSSYNFSHLCQQVPYSLNFIKAIYSRFAFMLICQRVRFQINRKLLSEAVK